MWLRGSTCNHTLRSDRKPALLVRFSMSNHRVSRQNIMRSVVSVCPSVYQFVSNLSFERTHLWLYFLHVYGSWLMTIARRRLKVKVINQGQCNMCVLHEYLLGRPASMVTEQTDSCNSKILLPCDQLRASATRCAAWRGGGQRQRRSPARVGVITR